MKRKIIIYISIFFFAANTGYAEHVFLKDGSMFSGKIIKNEKNYITLKLKTGKLKIKRNNIKRILYNELNLDINYIIDNKGTKMALYRVDEDKTTYTFRKKLNEPDELVLKKSGIIFIDRTKPTAVKGTAGTGFINLTWQPPFSDAKHYNIYYKTENSNDYTLAGNTNSNNYKLIGLKSKTKVNILIKAVDSENNKSESSNELIITTINMPPGIPGNPVSLKSKIKKRMGLTAHLSWEKAEDADGTVTKYIIYLKQNNKYLKISESSLTNHTITGLDPRKRNLLIIRSIDNDGLESPDSEIISIEDPLSFGISVMVSYIIPIGNFRNMFNNGAGSIATLTFNNYFDDNLNLSIETGYYYFSGSQERLNDLLMIPLMLKINSGITIFNFMHFNSFLSAGISCSIMNYDQEYSDKYPLYSYQNSGEWKLEPLIKVGIGLNINIRTNFYFGLSSEYGTIVEENELMGFFSLNAGAGYMF